MPEARPVYAVESSYEAVPLQMPLDGSRAAILSEIIRSVCDADTAFSDYQEACEERCFKEKDRREMCEACGLRFDLVIKSLLKPDTFVWEVWKDSEDGPVLAGIMRFSDVRIGEDAKAHYSFFDSDLRGKTSVMRSVIAWAFEDHPENNWRALQRITIEVPDFAFALARHASRKLGFGGPFEWKLPKGGPVMQVEGVKPKSVLWRGERRDLLLLGLPNPN